MQDSSTASFVARNSPANLPPDHRPEVAYTPSYNHLDSIFQAIRQQLQQWGDQAKWKIELVLLTPQGESLPLQYSLDESAPLLQSTINDTRSAWRHRPTACQGPHQINSHETATTRTNNELEQKLKDALKKQKHLENLVKMQDEQLRKLQIQPRNVNETIDAMRNMHIAMEQEQREKHSMETKLLRKEIHALSRKLKRMQMTLQRIENIRNSPEVERLDREELLEDRVILIRKLRLAELRLAARDAELTYLHDVLWLHEQQSDSRPKRKQQQQQQETDINQDECSNGSDESPASNELSKLESLGILADQMLSDPEFRLDTLSPPSKRVKRARYEDNAAAAADKDCPPLRRKIRSKVQQIDSSQPANNFAAQRYTRPPPRASESPSIAALLDTPIQSTEPSKQKSAFHNYIPEQHQTSNPSFSAPPSTGASTFYPKIHAEHFPATLMSPLPSSFKARPWSVDMQQQQSQRHGNTYSM